MKKVLLVIALAALALVTLACGETVTPTAQPSPTEAPQPPQQTEPPAGLTLVNNSSVTACTVYISPTTSDTWGANWLGSETLAAGSSRLLDVAPGLYDLLARDCDDNILDSQWNVAVSDNTVWTLPPLRRVQVTMNNRSGTTVCYVYISPTTSATWGASWLGMNEVVDDNSLRVFMVPLGSYDLRADDCDHNPLYEQYGFDFSGPYQWEITR